MNSSMLWGDVPARGKEEASLARKAVNRFQFRSVSWRGPARANAFALAWTAM
jgi:hypothetical protein